MMHILIIPGEELNPQNTYSSVFELNQASALSCDRITCGFISINIKGNLFGCIKDILKFKKGSLTNLLLLIKRKGLKVHKIQNFNVVEAKNFYIWSGKLKTQYDEQVITGISAFKKYVSLFGKPDIIHAHSRFLTGGLIALAIKEKYNIPFVLTEHSSFYARGKVRNDELELVYRIIQASSKWVCVSNHLGELITKLMPSALAKSYIHIPNVLDKEFETYMPAQPLTEGTFIFLNIASMEEIKSQAVLIKVFAQKFHGNMFYQLHIAGSGYLENNLKQLVIDLDISDQVKFLGQLSRRDVIKAMQNAHVFVLPSLYETFGVVLIEALALGRPVIATKCGGPESIVTTKNGFLVEPSNVEALSTAMLEISNNYHQFNHQKLRNDCIKQFGSLAFTKKIEVIYNNVLNKV